MVRNKQYVNISEAQGEKQNGEICQKHFVVKSPNLCVIFLIKGL